MHDLGDARSLAFGCLKPKKPYLNCPFVAAKLFA